MAFRQSVAVIVAALAVSAAATPAAASPRLSKREARAHALSFISPYVDMLDTERKVGTDMVPAAKCRRLSARRVQCTFKATLHTGDVIRSHVTVRLQKDGLLGYRTPLDVLAQGV